MYRDPDTNGCGLGNACVLLSKPGGKCTDFHSVFVALCRAAGVAARKVFGIRQGKKAEQDITKWQHCWAEFYLPGYDLRPNFSYSEPKLHMPFLNIDDTTHRKLTEFALFGEKERLAVTLRSNRR